MLPMNPKQMNQLMKQLGIKVEDIKDVEKITIETKDNIIIITPIEVKKIKAQGMETLQITIKDQIIQEKLNEEDISILMEKANISKEEAIKILKENNNDIVEALMSLGLE